ncbi:MAG: baseplate J/gp47 family protein [Holosporaceae bacterium]|jgi:phage-related baseplate assembly protein|nr:baseplate J/gp47 family protein [Holosporaceae bacterium]
MNLTDLKDPKIIEELSFEEILQQMKENLVAIDSEYTAFLGSDPLMKLLEVAVYRELLLRQRINQAAKANLLAFATGSDLDNLAAFYGISRKENETDEELRERTHAKIVGWSSAGSREAYKFHALNSDSRVKEANADSPKPGLVRISILSKEDGGIVSEDLLESVTKYMLREDVRMLTDTVEVVPCGLIEVNVKAKIILMASTPPEILNTIRQSFILAFSKIAGLGVSISRAWIISNLFLNGVKDVELTTPPKDILVTEIECAKLGVVELTR